MAAWGASSDVIAEWRGALLKQAEQRGVEIWPGHWHAWCVFLGMRTQWRAIGGLRGVRFQGLDYGGLQIVLAEHRRNPHRIPLEELMPQLRVLEEAARDELNRE